MLTPTDKKPSQDVPTHAVPEFDLESHKARLSVILFTAGAFFAGNHDDLSLGMTAVRRTYPEGRVPATA